MKYLASLLVAFSLASSVTAGTVSYSNPKAPVASAPTGCECFGPGFAVGGFGSAIFGDNSGDDALGGGVLAEYFFTSYIGIQASYGIYATDSEHHQFDGSLVLRYPITSLCIAPYVLVGGGFSTNSDQQGDAHVGGGIEARFEGLNCLGVFADGTYHWDDNGDFAIARLGVKIPF